jgi:hypothetical protein
MPKKSAASRERIQGRGGPHFVRRNEEGKFKEVEGVGRSLTKDRTRAAKRESVKGQGDRGDRR